MKNNRPNLSDSGSKDIHVETSYQGANVGNNDYSVSYAKILKDTAKQGVKALAWVCGVFILFVLINLIFIIYNAVNNSSYGYLVVIFAIIIGVLSTFIAILQTYRYIVTDTLSVVYKYLIPIFKKICFKVIDSVVNMGNKLSGKDINRNINIGALMIEVYGNKLPRLVQKGLHILIAQIPFSDFLKSMQKDLSERKSDKMLSEILFRHLDAYLLSVFKSNSMRFVFIILGVNILLQLAICIFLR